MHTIKTDYPDLPSGEPLTMAGLPVQLVNKKTVEVSDDDMAAFEAATGTKLADALKDNAPHMTLSTKKGGDS